MCSSKAPVSSEEIQIPRVPREPFRSVVSTVAGQLVVDANGQYWYMLQGGLAILLTVEKARIFLGGTGQPGEGDDRI